jgi:spore maturation protein CgeB
MKLMKITTVYPAYTQYFYDRHPELISAPYREQNVALHFDGFGWFDTWSHALHPLGYDVREVNANVKPLQTAWAREQGIGYGERTWMADIVHAQIRQFRPDILFIQTEDLLARSWLRKYKDERQNIKLFIAWIGSPIRNIAHFAYCDFVLTCITEKIEKFKQSGIPCYHLHHAFDPRILDRIDRSTEPDIDISFIGQIIRASRFHTERDRLLHAIVDKLKITIYSPLPRLTASARVKFGVKSGVHAIANLCRLNRLDAERLNKFFPPEIVQSIREKTPHPVNPRLTPFIRPPVFGLEMYRTLRRSKITLNTHIDVSPRSASNMRLFESTGVGTCLLTDRKENLATLFDPEKEVVPYSSAEECIEKAEWLLDNPHERRSIAEAGQQRTLKDHTFARRAEQLDEIIKKEM